MILIPLSIEKCVFSGMFGATAPPIWPPALPQNVTYLGSSLENGIREPALYKLLTIHNPNLISLFQVRGSVLFFVTD
jgi:hypothetical protein